MAAAFRFRLQAVLDWRQAQDEAAQRTLGAARQALADAETALSTAAARAEQARARTRDAEQDGSGGDVRAWHWNWIAGCDEGVRAGERRVQERRTALEAASASAQEARRGLRTLERLRERAFDKHRYQQQRFDQQALDALAASRFVRTRGE